MVDSQLTRQKQIALIMDKWQRMTITSDAMFGMGNAERGYLSGTD